MKQLLWIPIAFAAIVAGCKSKDKMSLASVSTATPTGITANSAQTGGAIGSTGGSTITKSGICWASHNNPSVSDSLITSASTGVGSFTTSLANLNANTEYYVRAFAINGTGTAYGAVDSFMTSKGAPTVTTTAVSNISPLIAYSGGTVTNDGGASVSARGLCWSTSPHPVIGTQFMTTDSLGLGAFTDSLINLASQTVYYVRAYATNSYGTAYGNEISFTSSSAVTVLDVDGNVYPTVVIGTQTWMGSNLRVSHYQNGDAIIDGLATSFDWFTNGLNDLYVGAYTFPNKDSANNAAYGKLYDPFVMSDSRGVCPIDWHVPNEGDWETLEFYEGMSASDTSAFITSQSDMTGIKLLKGGSSGLNLQLAGNFLTLSSINNSYPHFNALGFYWSSSFDNYGPGPFNLIFYYRSFTKNVGPIYRGEDDQEAGSIRCIKN